MTILGVNVGFQSGALHLSSLGSGSLTIALS
jgi:hypothetical protein